MLIVLPPRQLRPAGLSAEIKIGTGIAFPLQPSILNLRRHLPTVGGWFPNTPSHWLNDDGRLPFFKHLSESRTNQALP
jgi:hypothetical protein